jgi:hypothetical protein
MVLVSFFTFFEFSWHHTLLVDDDECRSARAAL